jgi:hypothetical protein
MLIEPCDSIKENIDRIFTNLSIVSKKYIVIHVRSGDNYLVKKENGEFKNIIFNLVCEIYSIRKEHPEIKDYYLLSDNCNLKRLVIKKIPTIKTIMNDISHLGEGVKSTDEQIKNNLLDFYIMSHAYRIMSFSTYGHGSGFSKWCAETYDIPYYCKPL